MKPLLYIVSIISLSGCSATIYSERSSDADFSKYHHYAFLPRVDSTKNDFFDNDIIDEVIEKSIGTELANHSLSIATSSPDLLIRFRIVVENREQQVYNAPMYSYPGFWMGVPLRYPYYFYSGPVYNQATVFHYKEGSIVIDAIDHSSGKLVWRGWTETPLPNALKFHKEAVALVHRIFWKFPIKAKGKSQRK